jgi:hypothetical protein
MTDLDKLEELAKAATAHLAGHDLTASTYGRMIFGQSKKGANAHILDIRGWGYLTGKGGGALGLSEEQAIEAQKAIEAYVVAAWNAVPELIALARRDGVKEPVAWIIRHDEIGTYLDFAPLTDDERGDGYSAQPLYAHPALRTTPADPHPDPLEALREAREALFDRYDDDKVSLAKGEDRNG